MPTEEAVLEIQDAQIADEAIKQPSEESESKNITEIKDTVTVTESELKASQGKLLSDVLRREKESLESGEEFKFLSEAEADAYDLYKDGMLNPSKDKKEAKESTKEASKVEDEAENKTPKEITDLLKVTGAKDQKDLVKKVKELANHVSTKAKEYESTKSESQELKKRVTNEMALWKDVSEGKKDALEWVEKHYGLVAKTRQSQESTGRKGASDEGEYAINKSGFLDDETAEQVNSVVKELKSGLKDSHKTIESLLQEVKSLRGERDVEKHETAKSQANIELLNESYDMARDFHELRDLPDLKKHVDSFLNGTNNDPKFTDTLGKVFDEVTEARKRGESIRLSTAFKIVKANNADLLISAAETKGRKSAYTEHQPSTNLSHMQKGGETSMYRNYSDDDIARFEEDPTTIPDELFDKDFNPLPKDKISKKLWKLFNYR